MDPIDLRLNLDTSPLRSYEISPQIQNIQLASYVKPEITLDHQLNLGDPMVPPQVRISDSADRAHYSEASFFRPLLPSRPFDREMALFSIPLPLPSPVFFSPLLR